MNNASRVLAVFGCLALTACGSGGIDLKQTLGLNREGPDEFRVLPRPPLSVPPEFNLRPPGKDSEYVSGLPAQAKAHDEVLGTGTGSSGTIAPTGSPSPFVNTAVTPVSSGELPSGSDAQLLSNAGSSKIDPQVRQKLLDDKTGGVAAKDSKYLFGGKTSNDPEVDASKEADRLKQDKDQNKPPTDGGDTPVIAQPDKGLLGGIFR